MQIIKRDQIPTLRNSGIESEQLLFPESCPDSHVTVTRVTIPPGATSPRHMHENSEQVWVAISGYGTLLLAENQEASLREGDVLLLAPGEVHGFFNNGQQPFVYISVTNPPLNFRGAYEKEWRAELPA
jgi:quercetin dioxygenase-like cupin family protein